MVGGPSSGASAHATSPLGLKTVVGCSSSGCAHSSCAHSSCAHSSTASGARTVVGGASPSAAGQPAAGRGALPAAGHPDTERWVGNALGAACWWASAGP